jgi:hypothetical protein
MLSDMRRVMLAKPAAPGSGAAVWLRKQVMTKLAENGGKVPDELKH